ncbi:hypothetical protein [Streptomyces bobili]|uniref:hypothetical protein n=1 Tax=Streptomyces bobili TaxID=67280 RepID=UPI0037BC159B
MSQPSPDARAVVRALDALTTQVRRIADARPTPTDDARRASIAAALTAEHYRRAEARILASPEEHCAAMADVVMRVLAPVVATDDDATTPAAALRDMANTLRYIDPQGLGEAADCCEARAFAIEHGGAPTTADDGPVGMRVPQWFPDPPGAKFAARVHEWAAQAAHPAPADEDAERADRRASLRNLINRAAASLTPDEDALLRQHVEVEMREADTARAVAAGNKRHVQMFMPELDQLQTRITKARVLHASHASGSAECTQRCERLHPEHRVCNGCGWTAPCPTARALDGTEQPTTEG